MKVPRQDQPSSDSKAMETDSVTTAPVSTQKQYRTASKILYFDFHDEEGCIHGFSCSHLLNYRYERTERNKLYEDCFTLHFMTHEVVLYGWRLQKLIREIREGTLSTIKTISSDHPDLSTKKPVVTKMTVTLLEGS